MTRTRSHCCRFASFSIVASTIAMLVTTSQAGASELTVARYSTIRAVPTIAQQDPLAAPVKTPLPASVGRVGEAVEALLAPSGYRLAPAGAAGPEREGLLNLPLPEAHRTLGPMPLRVALATLAGPAFILVEDPVHRLISFERCTTLSGGR